MSRATAAATVVSAPLIAKTAPPAGDLDRRVQAEAAALAERQAHFLADLITSVSYTGQEGPAVERTLQELRAIGCDEIWRGSAGNAADICYAKRWGPIMVTEEPAAVQAMCDEHQDWICDERRMALAQAALDRGATVTVITAPNILPTPVGAERVDVRSAAEMAEAVLSTSTDADVLIMAAAVADFRPETEAGQKIKRGGLDGVYNLRLTKTIDILAAVAERRKQTGRPTIVVGFAAETQNLLENAREKLRKKKLSLLVANDVSAKDAGFFVYTNRVTIIDAGGGAQTLPVMSKAEAAEAVCERVERLL